MVTGRDRNLHRVGSPGWAQRQCGIGRRALGLAWEPPVRRLAPLPTSSVTGAKQGASPFWTCAIPDRPRALPAPNARRQGSQKALLGYQFEGELATGGWEEALQPRSLHIVKRRDRSRPRPETLQRSHCRQRQGQGQLWGPHRHRSSRAAPDLAPCEGRGGPASGLALWPQPGHSPLAMVPTGHWAS